MRPVSVFFCGVLTLQKATDLITCMSILRVGSEDTVFTGLIIRTVSTSPGQLNPSTAQASATGLSKKGSLFVINRLLLSSSLFFPP